MKSATLPVPAAAIVPFDRSGRALTDARFHVLKAVPPEAEWSANLGNKATQRTYKAAVDDFMRFTGIDRERPEEFRQVTRAHVIVWRDELIGRGLSGVTIRNRLSALASLFDYLCNASAITHNPVKGVKRPKVESNEGKTRALGDHQARRLLNAPDAETLKGKRDRAILAVLLYHALRREEVTELKVKDFQHQRRGVPHLKITGKSGKTRYMPLHPAASGRIGDYLEASGHGSDEASPLFLPLHHWRKPGDVAAMKPHAIYEMVRGYSKKLGFEIGAHALRATAATNALHHEADIAKVQEWLGHANIATTKLYDRRTTRLEDSPTFKVSY